MFTTCLLTAWPCFYNALQHNIFSLYKVNFYFLIKRCKSKSSDRVVSEAASSKKLKVSQRKSEQEASRDLESLVTSSLCESRPQKSVAYEEPDIFSVPFVPGSPSLTSCSSENSYQYANAPNSPAITPDIFDLAPNLPDLTPNLPTLSRKLPVHHPNPPAATTTPPGFTTRASGLAPNLPKIIRSLPFTTPNQSFRTSPPDVLIRKKQRLIAYPLCASSKPPVRATPNPLSTVRMSREDIFIPFLKAKKFLRKRLEKESQR